MTRKVAMTCALFLTTVAGFIITATGVQTGFFGGGGDAQEPQPSEAALSPATAPPTAPPPQVVEQIVYRDEYVRAPASRGRDGSQEEAPAPAAADVPGPPSQPEATTASPPTSPPTAVPAPAPAGNVQAIDLQGTVTAVGADTFTLAGTRFGTAVISVGGSTRYEGGNFSSLTSGARVEAKVLAAGGTSPTGPNGTWSAVNVHVED